MQQTGRVSDIATEVLARQANTRSKHTGEQLEVALKAVLQTEAGHQLGELREGPHRDKSAKQWQEDLPRTRAKERRKTRREERRRAQEEERSRARATIWEQFMQVELRELKLLKEGQLARLLGKPLPGEPPAVLQQLASEDQRQAEEGLVALMSNGEVLYKHLEDLSEWDVPARIAANSSRKMWLKKRQEARRFGVGEDRG